MILLGPLSLQNYLGELWVNRYSDSDRFDKYLNKLSLRLINLVGQSGVVAYKIPDGVNVIECHQQQVPRSWTKQHLIFQCHDHEIIQLKERERETDTLLVCCSLQCFVIDGQQAQFGGGVDIDFSSIWLYIWLAWVITEVGCSYFLLWLLRNNKIR